MHRWFACAALLAATSSCARRDDLPAVDTARYHADWNAWASNRLKIITTPGRPPSFTQLAWLKQGATTIGAAAANGIVLEGKDVPARVGTLVRDGAKVRFEPAPGAHVLVDSVPAVAQALRNDEDTGPASRVEVGNAGFRIVRRVDSIGVRMWRADHPLLLAFPGLQYFPLDPAQRFAGTLTPLPARRKVVMSTVMGVDDEYTLVGTVHTTIAGKPYALQALEGSKRDDLFFTFTDETAGEETYGFRFLHALDKNFCAKIDRKSTRL